MGLQREIDWEDPTLERWLSPITKPNTRYMYRSAFRSYAEFTGLTASQLIDEALEDQAKDIRQRRDVVLNRLVKFYDWLKREYPVKSRGAGEHAVVKKGLSDKAANLYVTAVRSFYGTYDVVVRLKGRTRLPKPRVANRRMKLAADQVKLLVDNARTPRDKAIILCIFQSGMDVSTLCTVKYGDVKEGIARGDHPLKLDLCRPKTGVEYYSFLGRDAVEALKIYFKDLEARGLRLKDADPLFVKERSGGQPMETANIQDILKDTAVKAGIIKADNGGKAFNLAGPHALRESFGSIMINSGVPDTIVDFWLGHSIGDLAAAYKSVQLESLKKMYLDREKLISISQPPVDTADLERKVDEKVDERIQSLQKVIANYATENMELKSRMARVELEITELKKELEKLIG